MPVVAAKGTVLVPSGPPNDPDRKHLFIFLTDPHGPADQVLMVPVCSEPPGGATDTACLLDGGHHPFLDRRSYVDYSRCRIEFASSISRGVENGLLVVREPVGDDVFTLIIAGLRNSGFTKPFALDFYSDCE